MILVFGGTTEGRKVASLLDYTGDAYFYSTKTKMQQEIGGKVIFGAMDRTDIQQFCKSNGIRVIIDAAHPFAEELHTNIYMVASELKITTIRYERVFKELNQANIRMFNSFDNLVNEIQTSNYKQILALTGVQTIKHFKEIWKTKPCYFRILNRKESIELAMETGIPDDFIIKENPDNKVDSLIALAKKTKAELIVSKESGLSGQIESKLQATKQLHLPLWIVKRPTLPDFDIDIDNEKDFLKTFYPLRRNALKQNHKLRSGFTTGSCVTACAMACFLALVEGKFPEQVRIQIPAGDKASFLVFDGKLSTQKASCLVIKDAGDDPDITHGKEIGCGLELKQEPGIVFRKGDGIGLVTLPGLQLEVGEPAINPVPRKMITDMLMHYAEEYNLDRGFIVTPFAPEGKKLARQTFNERVGVIGGLSIIGTSGKVLPYSHEAFVGTIKKQFNVLKSLGITEVVLSSGKRSENFLKSNYLHLPKTAFIHFGNLIGESLKMAVSDGIKKITLALMFGKATKLAEGHLDTHSRKVTFNPQFIKLLAKELGYPLNILKEIEQQRIANAIPDFLPFDKSEKLYQQVACLCYKNCRKLLGHQTNFKFVLLSGEGHQIIVEG